MSLISKWIEEESNAHQRILCRHDEQFARLQRGDYISKTDRRITYHVWPLAFSYCLSFLFFKIKVKVLYFQGKVPSEIRLEPIWKFAYLYNYMYIYVKDKMLIAGEFRPRPVFQGWAAPKYLGTCSPQVGNNRPLSSVQGWIYDPNTRFTTKGKLMMSTISSVWFPPPLVPSNPHAFNPGFFFFL